MPHRTQRVYQFPFPATPPPPWWWYVPTSAISSAECNLFLMPTSSFVVVRYWQSLLVVSLWLSASIYLHYTDCCCCCSCFVRFYFASIHPSINLYLSGSLLSFPHFAILYYCAVDCIYPTIEWIPRWPQVESSKAKQSSPKTTNRPTDRHRLDLWVQRQILNFCCFFVVTLLSSSSSSSCTSTTQLVSCKLCVWRKQLDLIHKHTVVVYLYQFARYLL